MNSAFWRFLLIRLFGVNLILAGARLLAEQQVDLAWDPSTGTNIASYNVYYGVVSGAYSGRVEAGGVTSATVRGLAAGTVYYFAATAKDAAGVESGFSNEISYTVPAAPNQPPMLDSLANLTINSLSGPRVIALTGISSGSANENQTLTITATSSNPGLLPNPSVDYESPNPDGSLVLTPTPYTSGNATITVKVDDGQSTNRLCSRSFVVTISTPNQPPTLNPINPLTLAINSGLQLINLTGITAGAGGEQQSLSVRATSTNPSLIPNPSISYVNPNTTATLMFTPAPNAIGSATITVTVDDGQSSNNLVTRSFNVTVNPENQAPTLDTPANLVLDENAGPQTVILTGISSGATNEFQTLTITTTSSNPSLIPVPTVTYESPETTGTLILEPATNMFGSATITLTVNDGQTTNNIYRCAFAVTVNQVNQPPTLAPLSDRQVDLNAGPQTVLLTGISCGGSSEVQALTITAVSSNPNLIPNPTVTYSSPDTTGTLLYTALPERSGTATITVTVDDGQTTNNVSRRSFSVTVGSGNHAPTLDIISDLSIAQNAGVQKVNLTGISSGDINELQPLLVTAVSSNPDLISNLTLDYLSPERTGILTFTPKPNATGKATLSVTVSDGQTQNGTITRSFIVAVNPVNQRPTLDPIPDVSVEMNSGTHLVDLSGITSGSPGETQTLSVLAFSTDPGLIPTVKPSYKSPNTTGNLSFTIAANVLGTTSITVLVNDGQLTNSTVSRTFNVTIKPINNAPTLDSVKDLTVDQNAGLQTVTLTGISSGASNEVQTLTLTAVSSNPQLIPNPVINYTSPDSSGWLSFTPVSNAVGVATITVQVSDGQERNGSISRAFSVTVNPVNRPPTLDPIADVIVTTDGAVTVPLTGISVGGGHAGQNLSITAQSSDPSVTGDILVDYASPADRGNLTFTPTKLNFSSVKILVTVDNGAAVDHTMSRSFGVIGGIGQFKIGSVSVLSGQSTNVTLDLSTGLNLAELEVVISLDSTSVTNLNLESLASEVAPGFTTLEARDGTSWHLHFAANQGTALAHLGTLARLAFEAAAEAQSAFVPISIREITGKTTDGQVIKSLVGEAGRVVLLGHEALLEAGTCAAGIRNLTLYGNPNAVYALEYSSNPFDPTSWQRLSSAVCPTNHSAPVLDAGPAGDRIFYRAVVLENGR